MDTQPHTDIQSTYLGDGKWVVAPFELRKRPWPVRLLKHYAALRRYLGLIAALKAAWIVAR